MVALVVAVVFVGCKKEKETPVQEANNNSENKPDTEVVERKPIAIYDNATGQMTNYFDLAEIQQKTNETLAAKTNTNKFVIESVQIEDSNPTDVSVNPEIRITILDTDEEVSYTMWYMEHFVDKKVNANQTHYYQNQEVDSGVYEFAYRIGDTYYKASVNGNEITTIETDSTLCMGMIRWFFVCLQQGCGVSCEKGGSFWNGYCEPCTTQTGQCNQNIAPWVAPTISIIGSIIIALL